MDVESPVSPRLDTVLLVDEWDDRRITTKWLLTHLGCAVDTARSGAEALLLFSPELHDVVVIGNSKPGLSGTELAHIIKMRSASTPVILYAAQGSEDSSCVDVSFQGSPHLLVLRQAVETLVARPRASGSQAAGSL